VKVDYSALLYDPVYNELGVEAQFINGEFDVSLLVIDDTRPKILPAGSAEVRSVGPGAFVRIPELERNGISRDNWMDASLNFNGRSWVVRSYELRGSPNGEDAGEVRFLLKEAPSIVPPGPDWVPANAKVHIDLVGGVPQGRAWTAGAGEVAVDTLLGSDPNTEAAWSVTNYDPSLLTADGYCFSGGDPFAIIGIALSKLLSGATTVITMKMLVSDVLFGSFPIVTADGSDAIEIDFKCAEGEYNTVDGFIWSTNSDPEIIGALNGDVASLNRIASTITSSRLEWAVNGSSAASNSDMPHPGNLIAALLSSSNSTYAVQSITIYDPLLSTIGLSELSDVN
jgi:hypothetical protein